MAAEDAVLRAVLGPGDHLVLPIDAYGGTYRLVEQVHAPAGLAFSVVDLADPAALERGWRPGTRMVWVETPSNPLLSIVDIAAVAAVAHARDALALGADIVVHSSTKYLGGHSDVTGGFVALDDAIQADRVAFLQNAVGAVPGPLDCFLVQRGVKTLAVRMERHCANAVAVAGFLVAHPKVAAVHYPGLSTHPGHDVSARQMRGFGGMVSFLHAGGEAAALGAVARTEVFALAESLGAVESLIEHPARMTHASVNESALAVEPSLIRLSVGLETVDDLLADLDQALEG
jgi:cystathionine gamma-synthase